MFGKPTTNSTKNLEEMERVVKGNLEELIILKERRMYCNKEDKGGKISNLIYEWEAQAKCYKEWD